MTKLFGDFADFPDDKISDDIFAYVGLPVMGVSMFGIFICIILMFRDRKYRGIFKKMPKYIIIIGTFGLLLNILHILWLLSVWDNSNFLEETGYKFNALMIVYYTILFAIACMNILRDYMILYYFHYYSDFSQNGWIKFINDDRMKGNMESSWHVKYRDKYGSFRFMLKLSCVLIVGHGIVNLLVYILIKVTCDKWLVYSISSFGLIMGLYGFAKLVIICRIPKFIDDNGFMRYQFATSIILIAAIGASVALYIIFENDIKLILFHLIMGSLAISLYLALVTGYAWCHSEKIVDNIPDDNDDPNSLDTTIEQSKTYINISKIRMNRKGTRSVHFGYNFNEKSPKSSNAQRSDLELLLLNSNALMFFAQYLIEEKEIEYLLAYIEFTQYQARYHLKYIKTAKFMNDNNNNNDNNNGNSSDNTAEPLKTPIPHISANQKDIASNLFAEYIPNSSIVWKNKPELSSAYQKASRLCRRYIGIPPERKQLSISDLDDSKDELKESLQGSSIPSNSTDTINYIIIDPNTKTAIMNTLNDNYDDTSYDITYIYNDLINEIYNKLWDLFQKFSQTKIGYNVIMQMKQIDSCEILYSSVHSIN